MQVYRVTHTGTRLGLWRQSKCTDKSLWASRFHDIAKPEMVFGCRSKEDAIKWIHYWCGDGWDSSDGDRLTITCYDVPDEFVIKEEHRRHLVAPFKLVKREVLFYRKNARILSRSNKLAKEWMNELASTCREDG